ncbi:MAG: Preprotein translocase SecE subunit [Candidatus Wolfebacteria bacterium GW2011_GWE1_48_7]|uniref:Protein translocase subunit SecE n=2 Tax=Candidatus Wolfeibacteriota TaxID=1752735 RepID=A0A0G1U8H3_9BACT|nr:MAG: preprotein translocase subunit SecE, preprotein translocase subunit SecE [Candidatus Wolfebacteria bacterium GW2011_GWB1_47_1]KKU37142.1 MAG: Preprotein translocase SecE subunit [Candidatus Wolfebacteria bacterium GW2011_GWC2_46_275]KKU42698.1 MAG: Preprotein translocase SecE subunit [Candidatus Wolfebacteria bacterium GW2011_GWB2_46_69]KKU54567.1 MAG: Preprotein translocase SecE subunit [Candidatus Wolfebacteria bacterium GW2011_GWC1_47_103]KKU59951.1 MAG: Preprotein translocase SecE s
MFSRLTSYIQESRQEFKRVNWPTRQETIRLTGMVIGLSLIFAVFLGVLDMVFNYILVTYLI